MVVHAEGDQVGELVGRPFVPGSQVVNREQVQPATLAARKLAAKIIPHKGPHSLFFVLISVDSLFVGEVLRVTHPGGPPGAGWPESRWRYSGPPFGKLQ